jgi:hypothetical protein
MCSPQALDLTLYGRDLLAQFEILQALVEGCILCLGHAQLLRLQAPYVHL